MIEVVPYGDQALLINFEQKIDFEIYHLLKAYYVAIQSIEEVNYQIPAYSSITVVFNNDAITFEKLKVKIEELTIQSGKRDSTSKVIEIPVCYEEVYGPDITSLAEDLNLTSEQIISLHTNEIYDVFMMGFLPGFPYLGTLPKDLECRRKAKPRKEVESGSVGLAGSQTGIYPSNAPGGWQLIGRTPIKIFDLSREEPFLLKMGDKVKFHSISDYEFKEMQNNEK